MWEIRLGNGVHVAPNGRMWGEAKLGSGSPRSLGGGEAGRGSPSPVLNLESLL